MLRVVVSVAGIAMQYTLAGLSLVERESMAAAQVHLGAPWRRCSVADNVHACIVVVV